MKLLLASQLLLLTFSFVQSICPTGWVENTANGKTKCYLFAPKKDTAAGCTNLCNAAGVSSSALCIENAAENAWLASVAPGDTWLGLFTEGPTWDTPNKACSSSFVNWASDQPGGDGSRVVLQMSSAQWYAIPDTNENLCVCETLAIAEPVLCPEQNGWLAGPDNKCYSFPTPLMDHAACETTCGHYGGAMACVQNSLQNDYLRYFAGVGAHLGLRSIGTESTAFEFFEWPATCSSPFTNWQVGGPGSGPCALVDGNGQWRDHQCTKNQQCVCEKIIEDRAPSFAPSTVPSASPTAAPSQAPTEDPTTTPTAAPTETPSAAPSLVPTAVPTVSPTAEPTADPSADPTAIPTADPSVAPTTWPTTVPTASPTEIPTAFPSAGPSAEPSLAPTALPTAWPTESPTESPSAIPTPLPSAAPFVPPTALPTMLPTAGPSANPTVVPSIVVSANPSKPPTRAPTVSATIPPACVATGPNYIGAIVLYNSVAQKCYMILPQQPTAQSSCRTMCRDAPFPFGAKELCVTNAQENTFLAGRSVYWGQMSRLNGPWAPISGCTSTYTNWAGAPPGGNINNKCVQVSSAGVWSDAHCTTLRIPCACEIKQSSTRRHLRSEPFGDANATTALWNEED